MCLPCCAEANGKNENPLRKHEAQLTILPLQHSKVGGVAALSKSSPFCMTMLDSIVRREESLQGRCLLGISISVTDQQVTCSLCNRSRARPSRFTGDGSMPRHAQVVHFVRHGEGYHNIGVVNEDAHLTEAGWRQADALKKHIAGLTPALDIQVGFTPGPRRTPGVQSYLHAPATSAGAVPQACTERAAGHSLVA